MALFHKAAEPDRNAFSGKILILPVVSVGNVGQLAADLLIASLGLKRVMILDSAALMPVVGAREDGEEGVATPLELFGKPGCSIYVIQQRSPAMYSMKEEFTQTTTTFIQKAGFASVLLLCGLDVAARGDKHMGSPTYHYALPPASQSSFAQHLMTSAPPFVPNSSSDKIPFIPGGGLTRRLLLSLKDVPSTSLTTGVLLQFVMEGDNRGDAEELASVASNVVGISVKEWKQPMSWSLGLFGTPHDQTLYG